MNNTCCLCGAVWIGTHQCELMRQAEVQAGKSVGRLVDLGIVRRQVGDWQPITTAPKDGSDVLIFDGELTRIGFFDAARGGVWSVWPGRAQSHPTHWMPLPKGPTS